MQKRNVAESRDWFTVLQTAAKSQTAMMTLGPGSSSGEKDNKHPQSDQVLLVLEGEVRAEIGEDTQKLRRGDVVIVRAGEPHHFTNEGQEAAITFNVYCPPAY